MSILKEQLNLIQIKKTIPTQDNNNKTTNKDNGQVTKDVKIM